MITKEEMDLALACLDIAREEGAQKARVTLTKSTENLVATLNGEVDRVTRCADRSISLALFVDGRFGSFSTNKLTEKDLRDFIHKATDTVRMLAPDEFRKLPDPSRYCHTAIDGKELGIYDPKYAAITPEERMKMALEASAFGAEGFNIISEEGEYSDSDYDMFVTDTEGLRCRHMETSWDYGVEVTVEDADGDKYSDYWWHSAPMLDDFKPMECGITAARKATAQIGAEPAESGKYNMVVFSDIASKMVSPVLNALSAYSVQQNNSFLKDALGKKVFSEGMNIVDRPLLHGQTGSRLFDSEGVATSNSSIIENGVVKEFFVNTYMAGKLGMQPTVEDATRPLVQPWPKPGLGLQDLMDMCGSGILVTEFNGGNANTATGDFSYGISGQLFKDGKIVGPVCEMLVTGNFIDLWNKLIAAGEDYRPCMSKLVPSLAFADVDFNG